MFDLGCVDLIDSVGIGVLLGALRRARQAGGSATVSALSGHVAGLFTLLGIDTAFAATSGGPAAEADRPVETTAPDVLCGGRP